MLNGASSVGSLAISVSSSPHAALEPLFLELTDGQVEADGKELPS